MKQKITVFGSYVTDLMARPPHLPLPGETVKGSVFHMGAGGKGFNQAVAAKKAETTGAGDAFNGGLAAGLAEGMDIWQAARFASAVAAISVTRLGTSQAMPTRQEVEKLLAENADR